MANRLIISAKGTLTVEPSELPTIDNKTSLLAHDFNLGKPERSKTSTAKTISLPKFDNEKCYLLQRYKSDLPEGLNFSNDDDCPRIIIEKDSDPRNNTEDVSNIEINEEQRSNINKDSHEHNEKGNEEDDEDILGPAPRPDGSTTPRRRKDSVLYGVPKEKRFRKLARMVRTNLFWRREMDSNRSGKKEEERGARDFVIHNNEDGTTELLTFNLSTFKAKGHSYGGLTARVKRICMKAHWERTDEDLACLKDVVKRLKCFDKYSEKVKQELARVISYDTFNDGRIIIRQGHHGYSFYFIIKGAVSVVISDTDKRGKTTSQVIGELTEGSSFGELALLHDIERTATIVCKGHSEFLRIDKADFDMVLRVSYEYEWTARLNSLKEIPWFKDLSEDELLSANHVCKLLEFPPNKIIYGNTTHLTENVYYVVSGEAKVVREMYIVREVLPWGKERVKLKNICLSPDRTEQRKDVTKEGFDERHLIAVCTISRKHFYGLGEDLTNTYIISNDRMEILAIPRILFTRYGKAEMLIRMREDLGTAIPNNTRAFKHYVESMKWKRYRHTVSMEVVGRRHIPNKTNLVDVPLAIRIEEPQDDLQLYY